MMVNTVLPKPFTDTVKRTFCCNTFRFCEICKYLGVVYYSNAASGKGVTKGSNSGEAVQQIIEPIKMAYTSYEATKLNDDKHVPVIIMHGLLGSKSNWNSLSKAIHNKTKKKIIAVDARNHGESPHTKELTYNHLAADVRALVSDLNLTKATMIGHSMGGRTMMLVALRYPELVHKLVVVDISPLGTSPSLNHMTKYFEAMKLVKIEPKVPLSLARKSADFQLSTYISVSLDPGLRQFLITNLVENDGGKYKWRVNLDSIISNFQTNISSFPPVGSAQFIGPTLFIGGGNSDYLRKEEESGIKKLFPNASFSYIPEAGHWVHAEKPEEFLKIVTTFLQESGNV
ncbi:UNVERIFIED_CONTAM: hypothetical protein PYX00_008934 [Menopon gallinae]|uniref:sn-1-specific diacylglycerol lipase ABHD11 n=1 Tax=Menopon gallinae TaxID=328185 RepID=A0AAW2H9I2_9NEOP